VRYFTDTLFLCALYREQDNTGYAIAYMETFEGQIEMQRITGPAFGYFWA
jgi:hypothetical protein